MKETSTSSLARALSPWPGRALLFGLLCLFLSERALAGAATALPLRLVAAALVVMAAAACLSSIARGPVDARRYAGLQLGAALMVGVGGLLYAFHVRTSGGEPSLSSRYALVGALQAFTLGAGVTVAIDLAAAPM
ncbi:MAG: hypothetical protein ACO3JL_11010, partial [Myxococcota bacterium]